jgi:hypothetical protein
MQQAILLVVDALTLLSDTMASIACSCGEEGDREKENTST